jgi:hypothetical protein
MRKYLTESSAAAKTTAGTASSDPLAVSHAPAPVANKATTRSGSPQQMTGNAINTAVPTQP